MNNIKINKKLIKEILDATPDEFIHIGPTKEGGDIEFVYHDVEGVLCTHVFTQEGILYIKKEQWINTPKEIRL